MSLPWKKTKQSRISRFMSEFQHSPKRGSSLFVETGFPASLVDLFFKNRDRLRKSSKFQTLKRQNLKRQIETAPNAVNPNVILDKPAVQNVKKNANEKSDCVCGGGIAFVLMAFKVLIVMLLALSTKKLTIGITFSAFALLLTELAAARLLTRSKVCKTEKNGEKVETCKEETEVVVMEKQSLKQEMFTVRDLLLKKDEKSTSKSSRLKSKIVKKLRSYKKKKEIITKMKEVEESLSVVSEVKPEITEEEASNTPLMESKGDEANGIVVVMMVTVLVGLLSGKIVAIGLTLSCLCLKFGLAKRSGLCN